MSDDRTMVTIPASTLRELVSLAMRGASELRSVGLSATGSASLLYGDIKATGADELMPSTETITGVFNKTPEQRAADNARDLERGLEAIRRAALAEPGEQR